MKRQIKKGRPRDVPTQHEPAWAKPQSYCINLSQAAGRLSCSLSLQSASNLIGYNMRMNMKNDMENPCSPNPANRHGPKLNHCLKHLGGCACSRITVTLTPTKQATNKDADEEWHRKSSITQLAPVWAKPHALLEPPWRLCSRIARILLDRREGNIFFMDQ